MRPYGSSIAEALPWMLERIRSGVPIATTVQAAGFARRSLYDHLERYPEDAEAMRTAVAEAEAFVTNNLVRATDGDWRAAAFYLERRHPDKWGPPK